MCTEKFIDVVLDSFDEYAQYGVPEGNYSGYIRIDSTEIKKDCSHRSFADAVRAGIMWDVARSIPRAKLGEMNTETEVILGIYKFQFKIVQYERDSDHNFELVDDPTTLPDDEHLGRVVDLKITLVQD
jgi:hypothetical protein